MPHVPNTGCLLCERTDVETFKARVQIFPWRYECIWLCRACKPSMLEAIFKARELFQ